MTTQKGKDKLTESYLQSHYFTLHYKRGSNIINNNGVHV